jgi:hypothetical protein
VVDGVEREGDQATDDDNAQKRKLPGSHGQQPGLQAGTKSAANSDVKKKKETPAADEVVETAWRQTVSTDRHSSDIE